MPFFRKGIFGQLENTIPEDGQRLQMEDIRAALWENQQCGFPTGPTQTGLY